MREPEVSTSKFQQETHDRMFGGVDTTTRPHLVEDDTWIQAHNMVAINTYFSQVPPKVVVGSVGPRAPIMALFYVPSGTNPQGSLVALTPNGAYIVKITNGLAIFEQMYLENFQTFDNRLNPTNG